MDSVTAADSERAPRGDYATLQANDLAGGVVHSTSFVTALTPGVGHLSFQNIPSLTE